MIEGFLTASCSPATFLEKKLDGGRRWHGVMVFKDGEAFEVEFMTLDGDTFALETLMAADLLRRARGLEIAHAREVA